MHENTNKEISTTKNKPSATKNISAIAIFESPVDIIFQIPVQEFCCEMRKPCMSEGSTTMNKYLYPRY